MGIYETTAAKRGSPGLPWVAGARTYTLYERAGRWYVNFCSNGRQIRLSTGCDSHAEAKALVESYRSGPVSGPSIPVSDRQIIKMMERARQRSRGRWDDYALTMDSMRELVKRCNGYCEVSGHPLEDDGPFRPSLDRIDCSRGYAPDNVRIVCLIANTAMLHYGKAAFGELAVSYCRNIGLISSSDAPTQPL